MNNLKLFIGLLGQVPAGEVAENHRLEFVVAENKEGTVSNLPFR